MIETQHSFKRQLVLTLAIFSSLLSFIWASAVFGGIQWTEDHLFNRQLEQEFVRLENNLPVEIEDQSVLRSWLRIYSEVLPTGMTALLSEEVPAEYTMEMQDNVGTEIEDANLHLYRGQVGEYSITLMVEADLISQVHIFEPMVFLLLFGLSVLILFVSVYVARALGRRLAMPLEALTQSLTGENVPDVLPAIERKDEIGTLAKTFTALLNRLNQFLVREKQFTRHASHEMRTPVTIIQNSLSVLKLKDIDEHKRQRNLHRIESALTDISQLIDTFLMLGREDKPQHNDTWIDLTAALDNRLKNFDHPDVILEKVELATPRVYADQKLLDILLDNLVSNCFRYARTKVKIVISQGALRISNDIDEALSSAGGFGFGFEIVSRICDLYGWQWHSDKDQNEFFVKITFVSSQSDSD